MGVGRTDPLFDGGGELGRAMAARDWTLTPLGPPESWPSSLRSAVRILLTSRFAMWMGWGPELTFFYNDAYRRDTLRAKHPWALGQPARAVWAEIWEDIGPRIASVLESGVATWDEDLMLFLERSGYPEETYHTFSYSPLSADDRTVAGMLCVVAEDTDRVLSERRMATLRELATDLATGHTEQQVLDALRQRLAANPRDLPFTLTYLFDGEGSNGTATLAAATGTEAGAPVAPRAGKDAWPVAELLAGRTVVVEGLRERFTRVPAGAWPEPPTQAVAVPLAQPGSDRPSGFLVAGLNPFRHYDERYRGFVELLANQVATGLGNARAYEAERRRAEALAELDRAKTEFFTGISHEFRTPLTLIMGPLAEVLAAPAVAADPRLRTELDVVHRNGLRLEKLVNELLDFSRLQAGRMQANFEPVDLAAFTAELASVFRSAMERAGLEYRVDCPPLDEPVWIDRAMWEKVVLNLLSNAVKFTFDGRVTVAVRRRRDRVRLTVTDSGTGIPDTELPHLFERFHRVPQARSRSGEGSGIGLATVREVVALHGGTIEAVSTPGVGSTFTVTLRTGRAHLPAGQVATTAAPTVSPPVSEAAEPFLAEALRWLPDGDGDDQGDAPGPGAFASPATARVLVADDNVDMREYVQRLLADRYAVRTAADGTAALAAALADPPDLVVSDVMMPGLDGMALVAALREDARTAHVPVLLLSARAGQEAAVEGLAAGADDYLVKPFAAVELLARVDGHVELGRARRRERERQRMLAAVGTALDREPGLAGRRAALVRALVDEGLVDVARLIDDRTQVVAAAGPDEATERLLAQIRGDLPLARRVLATGEPALAEVDEDYVFASSDEPAQQELRRRLDMRSVVFVPLVARGRVAGLLATARVGGSAPQTETDLTLLAEIGERAAIALDNALLYDREQLTSHRLALLQRATAALSAAATPVQVAQVAAAEFERLLGSSASGVWELHADALEAVAERGWTERVAADWRSIHLDTRIMGTDAVRRREPVWIGSHEDWDRDYPDMREVVAGYGFASVAALPLLAGGRCLGVAVVVFAEERVVDEAERAAAVTLADQCALAYQRAALLAAESAARQTAEEIGEVVAALSGATTPHEVTDVVLQHAALLGAEATAILLCEGDHLEVVAAQGPAGSEQQLRLDAAHPVAYAVRTGQAVWQATRSAVAWPDDRFSTAGVDLPAQVVLPLLLGGTTIGAIALGFAEPPVFTAQQRATALTVAGQCALALDRARLHQAEHEIAEVLQRSLLPRELPRLERLGVAARYLPGAVGSQTGGDWYDLLPLPGHRTALVVGDVVGQGPAAAAVMGQLRSALAGYLLEGHPPAAALELLDAYAAHVPGAQGSTCACVIVDWVVGQLRWARAGHPPVLLMDDNDGARFLEGGAGTVLGVTGRPRYTEAAAAVAPGASVVLYTDGLVERRGEVLDVGLDRLRAGAAAHAGDGPQRLVAGLLAEALDERGAHDDVAIIAARLMPAPLHRRVPARAESLGPLRRTVDAWGREAGFDADELDDLQLALGEAAANAVEHAYGGSDVDDPEFEYTLGRLADGSVAASVRDFGTWRPPPADPGYRGRGIAMVQAIASTASVEPGPTGTTVRFTLAPPVAPSPKPVGDDRAAPGRPARLVVEGERLTLHGDIDPPAAAELRAPLVAALAERGGTRVVLDIDAVTYLASAGVGLVLELTDRARDAGVALQLHAAPDSIAARVLTLAGLASLARRRRERQKEAARPG